MSTFREYVIKKFGKFITIPWRLHPTITIDDVAFAAVNSCNINFSAEYDEHVFGYNAWTGCIIHIEDEFENYKNICLMYAVLHFSERAIIEHYLKDADCDIFDKDYLLSVRDYAVEHHLEHSDLGRTLIALGVEFEFDDREFKNYYFTELEPAFHI